MPKWYFSKERLVSRTPSRLNGVDFDTECRYRREGCRFIMDMGNKLGLRYDTMATGVIYFHRFYMKQSFKTFPRWVTACACLFLAGKVEETPKKCRDIIKVAKSILSDHHFQLFGENPREEVMMYERVLLQTIKFDLQVDHPYAILLKIGKLLKGDKGKVQKLVQMAWTFVNDSLSTDLCLRRRPETLAIAHLNLAGKLASFDLKSSTDSPSNKPWWLVFNKDCQETVIEEICDEMLELYGGKKKEKSLKTKEKMNPENIIEPSPNNSSSTSSPSVTNSPPFKKKRITNSKNTETRKSPSVLSTAAVTSALQSDGVVTKCVAPPPPLATTSNLSVHVTVIGNMSCVDPPVVENISPAVTSDALPTANQPMVSRTMSYTIPLNATSIPNIAPAVPCLPMPPRMPTGSFINPVAPHNSFLSGTYSTAPYGIISQGQGVESIVPTSTNSSFLPPTAQIETLYAVPPNAIPVAPNPSGFRQTFPNIPPPSMPSHQLPSQPPPQPHQLYPTHLQPPPPQQNVPPMPLLPHMMNSQRPSAMPGNNNQNWHSLYNRPNNQAMGGGGWLR